MVKEPLRSKKHFWNPLAFFKLLIECVYVWYVHAGMWYCSMELSQLRDRPGSDVAIVEVGLQTDLQVYLQLRQTWIILSKSVGFFGFNRNFYFWIFSVCVLKLWSNILMGMKSYFHALKQFHIKYIVRRPLPLELLQRIVCALSWADSAAISNLRLERHVCFSNHMMLLTRNYILM